MLASGIREPFDPTLWLSVLAICVVVLVVALWRRCHDRVVTPGDIFREQRARQRDQREICRSTNELLQRLEQSVQRLTDDGDRRIGRLETLLRDADVRIARLALPAAAPDPTPAPPTTAPGPHEFPEDGLKIGGDRGIALPESLPGGPIERPPRLALRTTDATCAAPPRPAGCDDDARRVYDLADAGQTPLMIATALRMPLGEVELVLNLRALV